VFTNSHFHRNADRYVTSIENYAEKYGRGTEILTSSLDEECERELEQEEEQEEEVERQFTKMKANAEADWPVCPMVLNDIGTLLSQKTVTIVSLTDAVSEHVEPNELREIDWRLGGERNLVYMTSNFLHTVRSDDLSMYLRTADAFVLVDGAVVLLSDREADTLLDAEWTAAEGTLAARAPRWERVPSILLHLSYNARADDDVLMDRRSDAVASPVPKKVIGLVQLFNGNTMFHHPLAHDAVRKALLNQSARDVTLKLPSLRGLDKFVAGSHLALLCEAD
jgi:hypothetical protein